MVTNMINEYNNENKITILKEIYEILINNVCLLYPNIKKDKEKYNTWFNSIMNSKDYNIITYSINNKIIAFLSYNIINNNLWISEVQVNDNYKNKGILKELLNQFISNDIINNYNEIYIHINNQNIISQTVFKHIGFKLKDNTIYTIKTNELESYIKNKQKFDKLRKKC